MTPTEKTMLWRTVNRLKDTRVISQEAYEEAATLLEFEETKSVPGNPSGLRFRRSDRTGQTVQTDRTK